MNNIKHLAGTICSLLLAFICLNAQAKTNITPENGWWLNPDVPGRGYAIEIQDNVAFIATFTYDPLQTDGVRRPIWFATAGVLVGDNVFEGVFNLYENGTCVGCPTSQNSINASEKHNVSIEFTSDATGMMTIDGESFAIERFYFAPSYADQNQRLLGQWLLIMTTPTSFISSLSNPISGDVLVLEGTSEEDGIIYIDGCSVERVTRAFCEDADEVVLARYYPGSNQLALVVDKGISFRRYTLFPSTERMSGLVDQYYKSNGAFDADRAESVYASRSSSKAFVQTGIGPAKTSPRLTKAGISSTENVNNLNDPKKQDIREKLKRELAKEL
jgi:hypothetical protein